MRPSLFKIYLRSFPGLVSESGSTPRYPEARGQHALTKIQMFGSYYQCFSLFLDLLFCSHPQGKHDPKKQKEAGGLPELRHLFLLTVSDCVALFSNIHVDFDFHVALLSQCGIAHLHAMQRQEFPAIMTRWTTSIIFFVIAMRKTIGQVCAILRSAHSAFRSGTNKA